MKILKHPKINIYLTEILALLVLVLLSFIYLGSISGMAVKNSQLFIESINISDNGTYGVIVKNSVRTNFETYNGEFKDLEVRCNSDSAGDINGDGFVDMIDVQKTINAARGFEEYNKCYDFNGDNRINIEDAERLIMAITGI